MMDSKECTPKCYHQSVVQYDEFEDPTTGKIISSDFEVCKECNAVIIDDKIIGYSTGQEK